MVKYTGGILVRDTGAGPCCSFDERLLGDFLVSDGYGKGVLSLGW